MTQDDEVAPSGQALRQVSRLLEGQQSGTSLALVYYTNGFPGRQLAGHQ